jgi:hypothetical protein
VSHQTERRGATGNGFQVGRVLQVMDDASHYREIARHARELAEAAWLQPALGDTLHRVAREFDEAAENIEAGVADAP